jgi:hypothetical protein
MSGGAKPAVARTDKNLFKKVLNFQRSAVSKLENPNAPVGIKDTVDRYKFERKFSDFSNQLTANIEAYISGVPQKDTGSLIKLYNDLVLYMKNILQWKNLSETERGNIITEFNNIIPQITQLLDIAITEKYVDRKQIEELYTNVLNQNYQQIKLTNYREKLEGK